MVDLSREDFDVIWIQRLQLLQNLPAFAGRRVIMDLDDVEHRRLAHKLKRLPFSRRTLIDGLDFMKMRALPEAKRMEKIAAPWRPWRSLAAWYMWRVVEDRREKR